jgi:hypothetical protein
LKPKPTLKSRNLRQAAWYDPADEDLQISLAGQKRLRKLRGTADEDVVSGLEYESRLRKQCVLISFFLSLHLLTLLPQVRETQPYSAMGC